MASPIPVRPKAPKKKAYTPPKSSGSSGGGGSKKSSSGGGGGGGGRSGGGGGGGGYDPRAAERRAIARENKAKADAAKRFRQQANNLEVQANALKRALNKEFRGALSIKLGNVQRVLGQQQQLVNEGYSKRLKVLAGTAADNEKSEGAQTGINVSNMARERNSAVAEAIANGAGETDQLQAQMMSLRNWQANQTEVTRSYFDTLRSVNSSLTDLNVDTKTARMTNEIQANADKEQLWTNFYNQRSEAFTQLGNVRGQQADYLAQANEMKKGAGKGMKGKLAGARSAFMNSAKESGKAWKNPGVSAATMKWQGAADFEGNNNASKLQAARTVDLGKAPEGAKLRKW